jgi:Kef-type K+ transport system membrane component KefB
MVLRYYHRVRNPLDLLAPIGAVGSLLAGLCIIWTATRLVGGLFARARQPRVVGEIVAGILIGPTVLGTEVAGRLFPDSSVNIMGPIGELGLVLYMFLVGLELDRRLLRGHGAKIGLLTLAVVGLPVALGFAFAGYFDDSTWRPAGTSSLALALFIGAGLSVTAFPVMARVLQEKKLMATTTGSVGVGAALVVTVLMFLVIAAAASAARGESIADAAAVRAGLLAIFVAVLHLGARPLLAWIIGAWQPGASLGPITSALLIGAVASGLVTHWIGVHALVGAFLFGASVPRREGLGEAIIARLEDAVLLFFLPVFFAVSGLATDLGAITGVVGLSLFLALSIAGKWGGGYLAARALRVPSAEAHTLGVLLNCRGLLILVVALIGLRLEVITPAMQAVFVVTAVITTLMTGPLVNVFSARQPAALDAGGAGSARPRSACRRRRARSEACR